MQLTMWVRGDGFVVSSLVFKVERVKAHDVNPLRTDLVGLKKPIPISDDSITHSHRVHEAIPRQRIMSRLLFGREMGAWIRMPEMQF